jgi:hypothetical protein
MKTAVAVAAIAACAGLASAQTVVQNQSFGFPLSPGSQTLNFDGFQASPGWNSLWQLDSVEVIIDLTIGADVTAENDANIDAPSFGLTLNGSGSVAVESLSGVAPVNSVAASSPLDASDGVANSGPDFFDFGNVSDSFTANDITFGPGVAPFDVAASVPANVSANAAFGFTGTTDASLNVANLAASGEVTLIYNYTVIPTPAAAGVFGLAGLAAIRRRR